MKFNLFNLIIIDLLLNIDNAQMQGTEEQSDLMDSMSLDSFKIQKRVSLLEGLVSGLLGGNKKSNIISTGIKHSDQQHEDSHPDKYNDVNINDNVRFTSDNNKEIYFTSGINNMSKSQPPPDLSYIEMMKDSHANMVGNTSILSFSTPFSHWTPTEDFNTKT